MSSLEELKEKLAAIEHERWADWQKWVHKCFVVRRDRAMKYRTVLPVKLVERWNELIETPYEELTEAEKQSDREQVDRYFPLLLEWIEREVIGEDEKGELVPAPCPDAKEGCLVIHMEFRMTPEVRDRNARRAEQRAKLRGRDSE